ncbi:hypothetical protein DY000_02061270 [Brassica cretica]|uniref:Uncharacterized protein n=1 Tax=Brassica cretica TaxID=69181 RepID=A0ABQ7AT18_BRACR|nr:hypothetical protein DY000_02061270 [Brassica cretica]
MGFSAFSIYSSSPAERSEVVGVQPLRGVVWWPSPSSSGQVVLRLFLETRLRWSSYCVVTVPWQFRVWSSVWFLDWAVYDLCIEISGRCCYFVSSFSRRSWIVISRLINAVLSLSSSLASSSVSSVVVSPTRLCRAPIGSRSIVGSLGSSGGLIYLYIAGLGELLRMWLSSLPVFLQLAFSSEVEHNKCVSPTVGGSSEVCFHRLKLQSCPGMIPIIWSSVAGKPKLPRRGLMFHQRYHHHLAMLWFGQAPASGSRLVASDCNGYLTVRS